MILTNWRRERAIRRALRVLSRQRVVTILQPGNVWVVELAPNERDPQMVSALRSCHLRGWAELAHDAVPRAMLGPDGQLPQGWEGIAPVFRLTEAGWAQLRRTHGWLLATFAISAIGVVLTFIALLPEARREEYATWAKEKARKIIRPAQNAEVPR